MCLPEWPDNVIRKHFLLNKRRLSLLIRYQPSYSFFSILVSLDNKLDGGVLDWFATRDIRYKKNHFHVSYVQGISRAKCR